MKTINDKEIVKTLRNDSILTEKVKGLQFQLELKEEQISEMKKMARYTSIEDLQVKYNERENKSEWSK